MKKFFSSLLSVLLVGQIAVGASAQETVEIKYDSSTSESATVYHETTVDAEKAEIFTVELPKSITLEVTDTTGVYTYPIGVLGDISNTHKVRIIPIGDNKGEADYADVGPLVNLANEDETYVVAMSVVQEKRAWEKSEIETKATATGTFTANNLEPGKYTGTAKFMVSLDDGAIWSPATCTTPATRIGVDTNNNGFIEDSEKDPVDTPTKKGVKLGHKFPDGCTDFPATCERCNKPIYGIGSAEQYITFMNACNGGNSFSGATVELLNDIDLADKSLSMINNFAGTFNGMGYTISNATIERVEDIPSSYDNKRYAGLFGGLSGATFKNLKLRNTKVDSTLTVTASSDTGRNVWVGGLVACATSCTFDNVHQYNLNLKATSSVPHAGQSGDYTQIGGIAGCGDGSTFKNCSVTGNIIADITGQSGGTTTVAGGITSGLSMYNGSQTDAKVSNCFTAVQISASMASTGKYALMKYSSIACLGSSAYNSTISTSDSFGSAYGYSTEDCKSSTSGILDVLNSYNDKTWTLDMEGINDGYPIIK